MLFLSGRLYKKPSFNNFIKELTKENKYNSLEHYNLATILNSNIFIHEIPKLWKENAESKCCFIHCSECKIKNNSKQVFNLMEIM